MLVGACVLASIAGALYYVGPAGAPGGPSPAHEGFSAYVSRSDTDETQAHAEEKTSAKAIAVPTGIDAAQTAGDQANIPRVIREPAPGKSRQSVEPNEQQDDSVNAAPDRPRIAPADLLRLRARAVAVEVVADQESGNRAEPSGRIPEEFAAESGGSKDANAQELKGLISALRQTSDPESKADILALLSDASERTGARIRQIITEALRPSQPLEVQRQALYLATRYNIGIVQAIAAKAEHPLQQDADAFLLERELEQGRRPAPVDQPDPTSRAPKSPRQ